MKKIFIPVILLSSVVLISQAYADGRNISSKHASSSHLKKGGSSKHFHSRKKNTSYKQAHHREALRHHKNSSSHHNTWWIPKNLLEAHTTGQQDTSWAKHSKTMGITEVNARESAITQAEANLQSAFLARNVLETPSPAEQLNTHEDHGIAPSKGKVNGLVKAKTPLEEDEADQSNDIPAETSSSLLQAKHAVETLEKVRDNTQEKLTEERGHPTYVPPGHPLPAVFKQSTLTKKALQREKETLENEGGWSYSLGDSYTGAEAKRLGASALEQVSNQISEKKSKLISVLAIRLQEASEQLPKAKDALQKAKAQTHMGPINQGGTDTSSSASQRANLIGYEESQAKAKAKILSDAQTKADIAQAKVAYAEAEVKGKAAARVREELQQQAEVTAHLDAEKVAAQADIIIKKHEDDKFYYIPPSSALSPRESQALTKIQETEHNLAKAKEKFAEFEKFSSVEAEKSAAVDPQRGDTYSLYNGMALQFHHSSHTQHFRKVTKKVVSNAKIIRHAHGLQVKATQPSPLHDIYDKEFTRLWYIQHSTDARLKSIMVEQNRAEEKVQAAKVALAHAILKAQPHQSQAKVEDKDKLHALQAIENSKVAMSEITVPATEVQIPAIVVQAQAIAEQELAMAQADFQTKSQTLAKTKVQLETLADIHTEIKGKQTPDRFAHYDSNHYRDQRVLHTYKQAILMHKAQAQASGHQHKIAEGYEELVKQAHQYREEIITSNLGWHYIGAPISKMEEKLGVEAVATAQLKLSAEKQKVQTALSKAQLAVKKAKLKLESAQELVNRLPQYELLDMTNPGSIEEARENVQGSELALAQAKAKVEELAQEKLRAEEKYSTLQKDYLDINYHKSKTHKWETRENHNTLPGKPNWVRDRKPAEITRAEYLDMFRKFRDLAVIRAQKAEVHISKAQATELKLKLQLGQAKAILKAKELVEQAHAKTPVAITETAERTSTAERAKAIGQVEAQGLTQAQLQSMANTQKDAQAQATAEAQIPTQVSASILTPAIEQVPASTLIPATEQVSASTLTPATEQVFASTLTPATEQVPASTLTPATEQVSASTLIPATEQVPASTLIPANILTEVQPKHNQVTQVSASVLTSATILTRTEQQIIQAIQVQTSIQSPTPTSTKQKGNTTNNPTSNPISNSVTPNIPATPVKALPVAPVAQLTAESLNTLDTASIASIPTEAIASIPATAFTEVTTDAIKALSQDGKLTELTAEQVQNIPVSILAQLPESELAALLDKLSPAQKAML